METGWILPVPSFGVAAGMLPPAWNAPVLSHGRLYLRGKDQIVVLDLRPSNQILAS